MVLSRVFRPVPRRAREIIRTLANSCPSGNRWAVRRWWLGWATVVVSTVIATFWAIWGAAETFHEGWYFRDLWPNVRLAVSQYFSPMIVSIGVALVALWRPPAGVILHVAAGVVALWLFRRMPAGVNFVVWPLLMLAAGYAFGRPAPLAWARRLVVTVPVVAALLTGAYPAWRVLTRPNVVDLSLRRIVGDGVDLVWAPAGDGWDTKGFDWFEAKRRCEYLSSDGLTQSSSPVGIWRLPTVDEAVRSMAYRGRNAGGRWDAVTRRVSYRDMPDKESPLWNPYSPVIYWWTADEVDGRAYRVAFNGRVSLQLKTTKRGYFGARCVKTP